MFDTIRGLPVHVLVVHGVVVLLPLMAILTVLVAWLPKWRSVGAWPAVAGNAVVLGMVWVAQESGEHLEGRVGTSPAIERHAEIGDMLIWFSLGLLAVSVLVALARNASAPVPTVVAILSVVAAVGSVVWVIRTGEAGSNAVWGDIVANTTGK